MPKTVLVICSSPEGRDFPSEDNQIMLKKLLGEDYIPEFLGGSGQYPEDLPTGKTFDVILFAGCNVLIWLFGEDGNHETGMDNLSSVLNDDGVIIFVEGKNYVKHYSGEGHYNQHSLSIPITSISLKGRYFNDRSELKEEIINSWNKYFTQTQADKYIVYKKKEKKGGKRKRRSITRRKIKRKTRYSK
jgi:hypothetical protein